MEYDIINGRRYKRCKENQIRNPLTKRCIDKNKQTAKNLLNQKGHPKSLIKYIKKRNKILKSPEKKKTIDKYVPKLSPIIETSYISSIKDMDKRIRMYKKITKKLEEFDIKTDIIIKKDKSYLKDTPEYEIQKEIKK